MNHARRVFVCLLGLVVILSILVFPISAQGNDSGAAKSEEDYLLQSQRNLDRSLSVLNTIATLIAIMVAILAIFIAAAAYLGFSEIKNWLNIRKDVEKKAETATEIIKRTKSELDELRNEIPPNFLTEKPAQEVLFKLDEYHSRLKLLEGLGVSLKSEDYISMGIDLFDKNDFDSAVKAFEKAIELKSGYEDLAWLNKGFALGKLGRFDEELVAYDKAIELEPDYDKAWVNKSEVLGKLGRYDEALEASNEAIELEPNEEQAWFNRARAHSQLGKKEKALSDLKKAIELNYFNKEKAKTDEDFKNLLEDEDFKKLVE